MEKQRKHRIHMSPAEIAFAEAKIHSINNVRATDHVRYELKADGLTLVDVAKAVKFGSIIEVNSLGRCVVRSNEGTVVVLDMRDRKIVTAWYNDPRDDHSTLDTRNYGWNINVVEYLGGFNGN